MTPRMNTSRRPRRAHERLPRRTARYRLEAQQREAARAAELQRLQESARQRKERTRRIRRQRILRYILFAVAVLAASALVVFVLLPLLKDRDEAEKVLAAEMKNTRIEYFPDSSPATLGKRADGSYFTKQLDDRGVTVYTFNPIDANGNITDATTSTREQTGESVLGLYRFTHRQEISVQEITPADKNQTPRLELLQCMVKPIDPGRPSYTGSPTAYSYYKPGSDQATEHGGGLFDDGKPICTDRAVFHVPNGAI